MAAVAASSGIKPGSNGTQCALGKMMLWGMDVGWGGGEYAGWLDWDGSWGDRVDESSRDESE